LPHDDPQQRKPDIGLATERLGWKPLKQLEQGLEETIPYFRQLLQ
jgi:UDP-glucuronate decarboxylase